jgi:large subunit ribosomal protein L6
MSKIGRKPIDIGNVQVEIKGQEVHYKGPKSSGIYVLPDVLTAKIEDKALLLEPNKNVKVSVRELNRLWGLNRALLSNKIKGAAHEFEKKIQIIGLGYKVASSGNKLIFSLGYSHKIDFELPKGVSVDIDKTGQNVTFKSFDKELVGHICSKVKALRLPEPYKGTGIKLAEEVIRRKAGKAKASA